MNKIYIERIYKAMEFIDLNLDQPLNLAIVSKVALYSPFHFHRLFSSIVGENLNQFILRKRIERAAYQLKIDKSLGISEIAFNNGFNSSSSFSKAFKKYYGISPSYLKKNAQEFSKIKQVNSKNGQKKAQIDQYICNINHHLKFIAMHTKIEIKRMPAIQIAYVTHIGAFDQIGNAYGKLMHWAASKGLMANRTLTCYHDNPEVTDINKIRQSACIELTQAIHASDGVNVRTIEAGKYAVGKFELYFKEFEQAWQAMMIWVSENGFIPNERRACYEIYCNNPKNHPKKKSIIEICVPIKSM
ncbi:AraC family transcriptional regulator [Aureispira anguillae]|uniref:AraC family transcriptional regulator n=1 Tax=Aureispira anguillae TaxID=2864201 RepID=A0A916DWV7_9BACT|nr:AraC family transcriptional regulator [Aureispira anguillae]BDS15237.1 AraC family transcriptional regulator [Aureispira anguillae]